MRKWLAGAVVLMAALVLMAPAEAYTQNFDKTIPLGEGGTLRVENVNGVVDVRAWDRSDVEILAVKSTARNAEDLDRVNIQVENGPGWIHVVTQYPQDQGVDVAVDYVVNVPRRVLLQSIATVNGDVRVTDVDGSGSLQTVNGSVEVFDCAGNFSAHVTNGNIREELRSLGRDTKDATEIQTMNGAVWIALPADTGAQLDAKSMNGEIRTEWPVLMNGSFGHGSFQGRLGPGGAPLRIRTVNGSIQIAVWKPTV
jgi:DUF4097 and DUF4098 domain-containing protein YvlB